MCAPRWAYGVVTPAFRTHAGASLLGVAQQPVVSFVPMLMFAILFGLRTDHSGFLLSAVRDERIPGHSWRAAVPLGVGRNASLISTAGAIMTLVFLGFTFTAETEVKTIGLGLVTAVLLDVTPVPLVLAPALLNCWGTMPLGDPAPTGRTCISSRASEAEDDSSPGGYLCPEDRRAGWAGCPRSGRRGPGRDTMSARESADRVVGPVPLAHLPGEIPWEPAAADGTRSATLHGDRLPGVQFSYAFAIPAGTWDPPHSHPADAHIVVTGGTLLLGYGDVLDPAAACAYPAGSYLFVPAGALHFDGADEDTTIVGVAIGPWDTTYRDA